MNMRLSGSRAIKHYFPDFREPNDWDFIVDSPMIKSSIKGVEYKCIPPLFSYRTSEVLSPEEVMTLKASHIFWDNKNWEKHYEDLKFLSRKGIRIIQPLFYLLYDFWTEKFGKRDESDLSLSKDDFFDNKLSKKYDHDQLHELLVFSNKPMYLKVLKDGSEVEPDYEKFKKLTTFEKIWLVREEVMVMAYERRKTQSFEVAYRWMLKKFLKHHAPIWEAIFIVENLSYLDSVIGFDYVEQLDNALYFRETAPKLIT